MFRYDINGIRAIAVVLVVLFHFSVPGFQGGFIGVDVFFVISGYLMTKIIFNGFDTENFNLANFYLSRCKRIIPPLFILILAVTLLVSSLLWTDANNFMTFVKHAVSSLGFFSNIIYWQEAGYFDTSAFSKWLLHTWSLSVEWQFYILYPIVLLLLKKLLPFASLRGVLLALACLSIFASLSFSSAHPGSSFFMLHTRTWELLAGAIVFLYPFSIPNRFTNAAIYLGLLVIISCGFYFNESNIWPGFLALIPVAATMLVLYANQQKNKALNNPVSQFLGKISYSLYLWHWPVVALLHHFQWTDNPIIIMAGIGLSILLAWLSFQIIEKRNFVFSQHARRGIIIYGLLISITGGAIYSFGFLHYRNSHEFLKLDLEQLMQERNRYWKGKMGEKPFEKDGEKKILVIGNSWATDILYALKTNGLKGDIDFIGTTHLCSAFGKTPIYPDQIKKCQQINQKVLSSQLWKTTDVVFVHDSYQNFNRDAIIERIQTFRENTSSPIYVFGPKMDYNIDVPAIIKLAVALGYYTPQEWKDYAVSFRRDRFTQSHELAILFASEEFQDKSIHYIDVVKTQCGKDKTCEIISENGELLYFDPEHLTLMGSTLLGRQLIRQYPSLLQ